MKTRKLNYPNKRHRVGGSANNAQTASFDDLNNDYLVNILSFLPAEDMNTVAICSRSCREARKNESLDQTRTAIIIIRQGTTVESLFHTITTNEWHLVFTGNRTSLKIAGIERLPSENIREPLLQLPGVVNIDLSISQEAPNRNVHENCVSSLIEMCPNLQYIDLSYLLAAPYDVFPSFTSPTRVTSNGCRGLSIFGTIQQYNITELCLDSASFTTNYSIDEATRYYGTMVEDGGDASIYMLGTGQQALEGLSIKNAGWRHYQNGFDYEHFPQEVIIKFVRLHPSLRWLRSDLTEENVAMLKEERPDIEFVS